jgi:hypothetical protein
MATLNDLAAEVLERLEEDPGNPQFWSYEEVYDALVEAAREATLISGEPQFRQTLVSYQLQANTVLHSVPPDCVALLRIQADRTLKKTALWDLDQTNHYWQSVLAQTPEYWFPFGLTQFGIAPQLYAPVVVQLSYIALPFPVHRPYTGSEIFDFQTEFLELFVTMAVHLLTFKEATQEFIASSLQLNVSAARLQELARFATKKNDLRFARSVGARHPVTPVEKR